ncbi:hypothetical protein ACU8KH_05378 [Lachancea thermotolerans]
MYDCQHPYIKSLHPYMWVFVTCDEAFDCRTGTKLFTWTKLVKLLCYAYSSLVFLQHPGSL